jgi:hypothetical protein
MIKLGKYQHYKNKFYKVIGFALHTETREKLVLYKALYETPALTEEYGEEPTFARPYKMFAEEVEVNGKKVPRFKFVD